MSIKGAMIAAGVAGMFAAMTPMVASAKGDADVKCAGVNACKGTGACKAATNECKGANGCKGKGWTSMSAKDCKAKGGTVVADKK